MKTFLLISAMLLSPPLSGMSFTLELGAEGDKLMEQDGIKVVDTSIMECVYEYCVYDPVLDKAETHNYILEIGRNASMYTNHDSFRRDSIVKVDYKQGITWNQYVELLNKYPGKSYPIVTKYLSENRLHVREHIFMDSYYYEEPMPTIEWQLNNESKVVCDYNCLKATASFRGRQWTAWYAEDILIDNGPWKFGGLPGLILRVEDDTKEQIFDAIQVRKSNKQFGHNAKSSPMKTDRKTVNKMMRDYRTDAATFLAGSPNMPTDADGNPSLTHKRRFYNPIEKD